MARSTEGPKLPPFPGKALRDYPIPNAELWRDDEFGNAVLAEYNERVSEEFGENPFLKCFKMAGGIIHGSNPFGTCLVDMIVRPRVRVATPVDLQIILESRKRVSDPVQIRGGYKDSALALRSVKEPNSYLAENLGEQLDPKMKWPVIIYLSGLKLVSDKDSPCGLAFEVERRTTVLHAPILDAESDHFGNSQIDYETGLPAELGGTGRYFYSTEEGLARVYLGRGSSIDTIWDELGNSQADGRVAFCDNSIPVSRLPDYVKRLDAAGRLLPQFR